MGGGLVGLCLGLVVLTILFSHQVFSLVHLVLDFEDYKYGKVIEISSTNSFVLKSDVRGRAV